jgi:hypothetical protein
MAEPPRLPFGCTIVFARTGSIANSITIATNNRRSMIQIFIS